MSYGNHYGETKIEPKINWLCVLGNLETSIKVVLYGHTLTQILASYTYFGTQERRTGNFFLHYDLESIISAYEWIYFPQQPGLFCIALLRNFFFHKSTGINQVQDSYQNLRSVPLMWATRTPRDLPTQWKCAMKCHGTKLWPLLRLDDHEKIRRS